MTFPTSRPSSPHQRTHWDGGSEPLHPTSTRPSSVYQPSIHPSRLFLLRLFLGSLLQGRGFLKPVVSGCGAASGQQEAPPLCGLGRRPASLTVSAVKPPETRTLTSDLWPLAPPPQGGSAALVLNYRSISRLPGQRSPLAAACTFTTRPWKAASDSDWLSNVNKHRRVS